jgi:hypothetical protein
LLFSNSIGNPPKQIARLFKEVLQDEENFKDRFKMIVFAIIDDHNAHKAHNPDGNIAPFGQVFGLDVLQLTDLQKELEAEKRAKASANEAEAPQTSPRSDSEDTANTSESQEATK